MLNCYTHLPVPTTPYISTLSDTTTTPRSVGSTQFTPHAILDSGASAHFLIESSCITKTIPTINGISVVLPDGSRLSSTHTTILDWPQLPMTARIAHVIPGMKNHSLLSVVQLCEAGCSVIFTKNSCTVSFEGRDIITGTKCPRNNLWYVPLKTSTETTQWSVRTQPTYPCMKEQTANGLYHTTTVGESIQFLHQCFGSPTIDTFTKAIDNDQLIGIPGNMSSAAVRKHLPPSTATTKGHMHRRRSGLRSTSKAVDHISTPPPLDGDMTPHTDPTADWEVCVMAVLADRFEGTTYTDLPGRFPVRSYRGNNYIFICYEYRSNAILARAMKSMTDNCMVSAFTDVFEYLTSRGIKPRVNVMDNQCSRAVANYIRSTGADIQLVDVDDHRLNAAERSIQTFVNHFVASLNTADTGFPLQLWDECLGQVQDTLNMLRRSRVNPRLSAYAILDGQFNFNRTPLAPIGTKALVYVGPDSRKSYESYAVDGWYVGPAKLHYRNYRFYIPATKGFRFSPSAKFLPMFCSVPAIAPQDNVRLAGADLIAAIQKTGSSAPLGLDPLLVQPLRDLAAIFDRTTHTSEQGSPSPARPLTHKPPRVSQMLTPATSPRVTRSSGSSDPTARRTAILPTKFIHSRVTRNNTPHNVDSHENAPASVAVKYFNPAVRSQHTLPHREKPAVCFQSPIDTVIPIGNIIPSTPHHQQIVTGPNIVSRHLIPLETLADNIMLPMTCQPHEYHFMGSGVVHPITNETILKYERLANDPLMAPVWTEAMCIELGRLCQGWDSHKGTNTLFFMSHAEIRNIPKDRTVTYARICVDYRAQKKDPNRVRITAGGNLITYPGELTTRTADLVTSKIMWNSVLSTPGARYACADISNFYLATPLDRYEYMRIPERLVPERFKTRYNLHDKGHKGFLYLKARRAIYGLPQAGRLSNELLKKRLLPHGYYEVTHTPGVFRHLTRPISFTLVVDDFGINYVGREHAVHLLNVIKLDYEVDMDWNGGLYCGVTLTWDYDKRFVDVTMPGYVKKQLLKYKHIPPRQQQHCPFEPAPIKYGRDSQIIDPPDPSPPVNDIEKKYIQQVIGSFLYYARAVDPTILPALNDLALNVCCATHDTLRKVTQLLDYMWTHDAATIRYYASDMVLNLHSDASYLSVSKARSRGSGHFFIGSVPERLRPIRLNGAIHTLCTVLPFVASSAAEAELGALFMNAKEAKVIRLCLEELGHPQPAIPTHVDNSTAIGIVNNTIRRQKSRSMEMRYFWLLEGHVNRLFDFQYHPGQENLADYTSKHHPASHHQRVRPFYLHTPSSPRFLPRATKPSDRRGCVELPEDSYIKNYPLPKILHYRSQSAAAG